VRSPHPGEVRRLIQLFTSASKISRSRGDRTSVKAVLSEGTPAPDFTVPDQDGVPVTMSDLRGRWVLLWWYPKADTPG
jgi:cytochrome oxidase Cu insertion factor (SCO1/SenC/PrrC family)